MGNGKITLFWLSFYSGGEKGGHESLLPSKAAEASTLVAPGPQIPLLGAFHMPFVLP